MSATGRKLDFRCFLEGIEVPCVTAAVQGNFDAPSACSIQCIPTPAATRLKARTSVNVFYKDLSRADKDAPYLVYFTGEIISYTFSKTPQSLSIVYQAVDDSSYWDTAYQYFTDYGRGSDWLFQHKSSFMGTGVGLFDSIFREHASVIAGLLRTSPKTYPQLRGLAGGVVHILEAVGGVQGRFRGFNDFFTMAELRRRILAQISAAEADDTSVRIYNHKVFWEWLMRQLGSVGSMVSIRDMIKLLFQYIFHNVVPNPIAKFDAAGQTDIRTRQFLLANTKTGKTILRHLNALRSRLSELVEVAQNAEHVLVEATVALNQAFKTNEAKIPGEKYTIFAASKRVRNVHGAVVGGYNRAYNRGVKIDLEKTRAAAKGVTFIEGKLEVIKTLIANAYNIAIKDAQAKLDSPQFTSTFSSKGLMYQPTVYCFLQMYSNGQSQNLVNLISRLPEYKTPTIQKMALRHIQKALQTVDELRASLGAKVLTSSKDFTPKERFHTQIFRPDVWFVSPPRCNVFFPDDYIEFNYSRSFLQEITRMELTTAMELIGSNQITNSRYYAPNIQDISGKYVLQSAKSGTRLIMPHEIYTGILPKFEFMSEANIFAANSDQKRAIQDEQKQIIEQQKFLRQQVEQLRQGGITPGGNSDVIAQYEAKIQRLEGRSTSLSRGGIPYIQRAVNFMYFKQRFAARAMSLTANFTARVVLGFPGVVIHRPPMNDDPSQFLGMVAGFGHSGSQQGGATQISFSQAREHNGVDDEFLRVDGGTKQNIQTGSTRTTKFSTGTVNGALNRKILRLEQLANIKEQTASVTAQRTRVTKELRNIERQAEFIVSYERRRKAGKSLSGFRGPNGGVVVSVQRLNPGFKTPEQASGKTTTSSATSTKRLPLDLDYAGVYVVREKFLTITRTLNMPPEEQIYPTWLSPIYRNETIGKDKVNGRPGVYQQFFGCKAITDDPGDNFESRKQFNQAVKDNNLTLLGTVTPSKTIKEAVDEIVAAYDAVKKRGLDVRAFIDEYTNRPIATMEEIMGSADLVLGEDGSVISGRKGFHSFAFGDFDKLQGFEKSKQKIAAGKDVSAKVARELDTRKKKLEAVLLYRKELDRGVGQLGG